jgi:CubicO group peptidase (beta-lactamase class C family)
MSCRNLAAVALLLALTAAVQTPEAGQNAPSRPLPTDAAIRKILAERIDAVTGGERSAGIVVGLIGPEERRVVAYGHRGRNDGPVVNADTCFEIGSATKAFTALLLAEMASRGEVALDDPVQKHLPAGRKVPERGGRAITLLDLATHTAALPFMPEGTGPGEGAQKLYEFLGRYTLPRDSGTEWDYSNVGYWLLGEALAARAGVDYQRLLIDRIVAPLGLTSTAFTPTARMKANLAVGHDTVLQPAPSFFDIPVYRDMPAAGGLMSSANDLLHFLAATMGHRPSPLGPAIALQLGTRRPIAAGRSQALGWMVIGEGDGQLILHDGGTMGHASSIAWDPAARVGVVVLSSHVASVSDIARHVLRPDTPLAPPARRRKEITLDPGVLDRYAGRYEAAGEGVFVVSRDGTHLTIEPPADWGLPTMRLRPESVPDFFVAELPLRVIFQVTADSRVTGALIYPPRGQKPIAAAKAGGE